MWTRMQVDNKVTQEHINDLLKYSKKDVNTVFDKVTIVTVQLPNGYTITESSGCVDPDNYNQKLGEEVCMEQIEHRLWQLEGYLLQEKIYEKRSQVV